MPATLKRKRRKRPSVKTSATTRDITQVVINLVRATSRLQGKSAAFLRQDPDFTLAVGMACLQKVDWDHFVDRRTVPRSISTED